MFGLQHLAVASFLSLLLSGHAYFIVRPKTESHCYLPWTEWLRYVFFQTC